MVMSVMRAGHTFVGLVFLLVLLVSACPLSNSSLTFRYLLNIMVYPRRVIISSGNISFTEKSRSFFDGVSVSVGVLGFFLLQIFRITVHYTR